MSKHESAADEAFWAREAAALTTSAEERRLVAPVRMLVLAIVAATGLIAVSGPLRPWMLAWAAGNAAIQAFEIAALWRFRPGAPPPAGAGPTALALIAVPLVSTGFATASILLWRTPGLLGPVSACLLLAGAVVNVTAMSRGSALTLAVSAGPHAVFLVLAPLLSGRVPWGNAVIPVLLGADLVFMAAVLTLWNRVERMRGAEMGARKLAETRLVEAQGATAAKTRYAAAVSHELRTPLTAILAAADTLARRLTDPADAECARMVADAGRQMRRMLDDLLDLAKMEAGRMGVEAIAFSPAALLGEVRRFWAAEASGSGLALTLTGDDALPAVVLGDPGRLRQVLNNLLSNAVKFTASGGVTLETGGEALPGGGFTLRVTVADTGCGIEPERLARLFSPFEQAGDDVARLHGGTGLGLAISRELARLMGGDLTAEPSPGGSRFHLSVTLGAADALPAAAPAVAIEPLPPVALRLLVVDDQPLVRRAVAILLEPLGVTPTFAETGTEALEQLDDEPFDLVLMDLHLPDVSGREVTAKLRARPGPNRRVPIIALSGAVHEGSLAANLAAGMDGFIEKPLEPAKFYAALDAALRPPETPAAAVA